MSYVPNSGSVAAWLQSDNASVITVQQGSTATVIVGGSIAASFTPPANQSVSGTVATNVQGSVATVIIGGSIAASFTPPANQSVSGTVGASAIGLTPVSVSNFPANQSVSGMVTVGSLISMPAIVSSANSTTTPVTSTLSFTGTSEEWKDFGSIVVNVFTDAVSGVDGLSIQQSSNGTNWDITDTYTVPSMLAGQGKTFQVQPAARFGRVVYTQGAQNSGAFRLQTIYHPQMVKPTSQRPQDGYSNETDLEQVQGFGMVYNGTTWDRMRGTTAGTLVTGSVQQGTTPWTISSVYGNISGSVVAFQGAGWSGSVAAFQAGTRITSISGNLVVASASIAGQVTVVSSIAGGIFPISGSVAATIVGTPNVNTAGSVVAFQGGTWSASVMTNIITSIATAGQVMGSVAALQATNPWIVNFQNSSVLAVPTGSVITVLQGASIVGSYAEDAAHTSGDKGIFGLNVRNDTMSSITSTDSDYSPMAVGPTGEVLVANAPITKWVYGTTSIVSGASVALIAAQGASIFTYITGLNIVNPSANNLTGNISTGAGAASVLVYWTAPANGGSNMVFPNPIRSRDNTAMLASISGVGSILLSAQGFISKT